MAESESYRVKRKAKEIAKSQFERESGKEGFYVKQLSREGDKVKLWRCGRQDSSYYAFWICSAPHCIMVYGDIGEYMWMREPDMIPWMRKAVHSFDYLTGKVPSNISVKVKSSDMIEAWFVDIKREYENDDDWTDDHQLELDDIRAEWENYGAPHDFEKAVYESKIFGQDCDCVPNIEVYDHSYLLIIEGMKWFFEKLDAGEVIPP